MSEPIRDRRPTEADGNRINEVEYWDGEEWVTCCVGGIIAENPETWWRPIDQTPPPEPEKPERWRFLVHGDDGPARPMLEVRPGDPPDLDALLEAIDAPGHDAALPICYRTWISRVLAARHGEGGDA